MEEEASEIYLLLDDDRYSTCEVKMKMKHEDAHCSSNCVVAACLLERHAEDEGGGNLPSLAFNYQTPT